MDRGRGVWAREVDFTPFWRLVRDHPAGTIVALGALLRILVYLQDRSYWMDEASLLGNIDGVGVFDFSGPLVQDQLAPFGFLVVERAVVRLLGGSGYATRLVPLLSGLAALWLFKELVERRLPRPSALVALALFAFSDDLVYYASELKQYSTDLAYGLAIVLVSAGLLERPLRAREAAALGLLAIAAPWISFSSAFIVAGCGAVLVVDRARRARWTDAGALLAVAACWLASFWGAYRAAQSVLNPATTLYVFWNFAFFHVPPTSRADLLHAAGLLLECFVNPMNLVPRSLPAAVVAFPIVILAIGAVWLARRQTAFFLMLALPIVLAMISAAMRRYPFHGRLILGLLPFAFLLLAEGADGLRVRFGRRVYALVVVLLLAYPCLNTLYQVSGTRARYFNSHGDLHDNRFIE